MILRETASSPAGWFELDIRFVQLFHRSWNHHNHSPKKLRMQACDVDQPPSALLADFKQRGLPEDTLVVFNAHVRDFNATILHQLSIDHKRLTVPFLELRPTPHRCGRNPHRQKDSELGMAAKYLRYASTR